jgi:hypothetical protein
MEEKMAVSKTAESTAQMDTGSVSDAAQATGATPAEPIVTQTSLTKTPPPTNVGAGQTAKFTFTETADEPSVHVTAEEAARLEDNSLLTCLKKQHRKTNEEREAFLVYFAETVRRFSRPRLRDANGKFVSDGKPTLPEAFAAIGLSFEAEQKRSERYRKQLKELAELAAPALTEGSEESLEFSVGEEVYLRGAGSATTYYVVGKDEKSNTCYLLSSDGKEEKKKVSPEELAPTDRPPAHKLKEGQRYVDMATGREFVYDGNGELKRIVLPKAVQQVLDNIMQRDLDAAISKANEGVPTAEEKAAQKSRREDENRERDRKKIEGNKAAKAKTSKKVKATAAEAKIATPAKVKTFVTKRLDNPVDDYVFGTFNTDDLNTPLSKSKKLQDAEAATARLNAKYGTKGVTPEAPVAGAMPQVHAPRVEQIGV